MFHFEPVLFRFVREYIHRLVRDIDPNEFNHLVFPGTNTPHWILGHLVVSNEFALKLLELKGVAPPEWFMLFGPGSAPAQIPAESPLKEELLQAFDTTHQMILTALPGVSKARLEMPHSVEMTFLREFTPTVGDLLAHLLTTHPASHLGQLSFWRRMMGLPGVLA